MSKPREYDLSKPEEVLRWFREMKGYMGTHQDGLDFASQGTDREGRQHVVDAFDSIQNLAMLGADAIDV